MNGILQIKKGRPNYYVVLDYVDADGKRKRPWIATDIPVAGNHKREANVRLKEVMAEYDDKEKQQIDFSNNVIFTDYMTQWLETLKYSIAPTTYDGYKLILKTHIIPYFEPQKIRVKDLTKADIQQYVNFKMEKLSPNTIIKHLRNISKCLDSAVWDNILTINPVKRIKMPKKIRYTGAKHYNEKQIVQLLECVKNDPLEIITLLTIFYGLRKSEALGLKWQAVDFENNTITIMHTVTETCYSVYKTDSTKNDASYSTIPLPNMIKAELKKWRAKQIQYRLLQPNDYCDDGYICTYPDGSVLKPNYVTQHFKRLLQNNNLPKIRFHDLRHSSAHYLKYLGFDLKDIQAWLRHSDISTTGNIYLSSFDMDAKRSIANSLNQRFESFGI